MTDERTPEGALWAKPETAVEAKKREEKEREQYIEEEAIKRAGEITSWDQVEILAKGLAEQAKQVQEELARQEQDQPGRPPTAFSSQSAQERSREAMLVTVLAIQHAAKRLQSNK